MEDYRIEKVKYDDGALKEYQALLRLVFNKRADKFSFEYLKWQYADNPVGKIVGFNAYYGDLLAAHYVTMPIYMLIDGNKTLGLLSLNTATHPAHRGKGLFSILAEKTYLYSAENNYKFVIGVANANSTHGFIKHLNFRLIGPLVFKIGIGLRIYQNKDFLYSRYWDKELINWRLQNPSKRYFNCGDVIVSPVTIGFKTIVCHYTSDLPKLFFHPFNLYIGLGANLSKGLYFDVPKFIEHSPFNLIFRDLTNGSLPEVSNDNIKFDLLDFDVA